MSLRTVSEGLDLDALERAVPDLGDVSPEEAPMVLARVAAVQARLGALASGLASIVLARGVAPTAPAEADRLLNVAEAARELRMSEDWVYKHKDQLPSVRNGRRLLFSQARLRRYVVGRLRGSIQLGNGGRS